METNELITFRCKYCKANHYFESNEKARGQSCQNPVCSWRGEATLEHGSGEDWPGGDAN
jgi:hypothetical protein